MSLKKDSNAMPLFTFICWIKLYTSAICCSIVLGVSSVLWNRTDHLLRISRFHYTVYSQLFSTLPSASCSCPLIWWCSFFHTALCLPLILALTRVGFSLGDIIGRQPFPASTDRSSRDRISNVRLTAIVARTLLMRLCYTTTWLIYITYGWLIT